MSDQALDELIYFNGLNIETGGYFDEPMTVKDLAAIASHHRPDKKTLEDLEGKKSDSEASFGVPIEFGLGDDLKKVGWGMIFPNQADPKQVDAILNAMKPLTDLRQEQAGKFFKIIRGKEGYRWFEGRGETKSEFLKRFELGPGEFSPRKMPFYLLIVADPLSIPFSFQHELDVQYAVGRIYFQTLQEYASYAQSVVLAETGKVKLPRRSVFFGVGNREDKATALSAEHLIKPLHNHVQNVSAENEWGWESTLVEPDDALKENLRTHLGETSAPAIFFSASHGIGWPYNHNLQYSTQGALVCQDWRRFDAKEAPTLKHILTAAEIPDTANLLGSMVFPFACFGLGTPYKDEFAIAKNLARGRLAPRPFLSALPLRLLGHPNGGALAVIGHVERAWPHSFSWGELKSTTGAFESLLTNLMNGMPVGLAMDRMNLRYAEIATTLADNLKELVFDPEFISATELTYQWTANNDARGYAILGDPAARLSLAEAEEKEGTRPSITLSSVSGALPVVFSPPALESLDDKEKQGVARQNDLLERELGPFSLVGGDESAAGEAINQPEAKTQPEAETPDAENAGVVGIDLGGEQPAPEEPSTGKADAGGAQVEPESDLGGGAPPPEEPVSQGRRGVIPGAAAPAFYASPFEGLATAVRTYAPDESFGPVDDFKRAVGPIVENLNKALLNVADKLQQAAANITTLEVSTSVVENLEGFNPTQPGASKVSARFKTAISLTGDINLYLSGEEHDYDEVLLELHREMVQQAQANRMEMIKALGDIVASLFGAKT